MTYWNSPLFLQQVLIDIQYIKLKKKEVKIYPYLNINNHYWVWADFSIFFVQYIEGQTPMTCTDTALTADYGTTDTFRFSNRHIKDTVIE